MKSPKFRLDLTYGEFYVLGWMFTSQKITGEYFSPKVRFMKDQESVDAKINKAWGRYLKKRRTPGKSDG